MENVARLRPGNDDLGRFDSSAAAAYCALSAMSTRETLEIQNFGPIRHAHIDVRDITLLLGPQATGKSLTAQTLYFMRGMEELLVPETWGGGRIPGKSYIDRQELAGKVSGLLANWLGIGGISYSDTFVSWSLQSEQGSREDRLELSNKPGGPGEQARINQSLAARVDHVDDAARSDSLSMSEEQVYIPAGRMLYSFVPPSLGMFLLSPRMKQDLLWPGYINVFYRKLGSALRSLFDRSRASNFSPFVDPAILEQMSKIMKGKLGFSDPDRILLSIEDKFAESEGYSRGFGLDPLKLASGQMEQWPFWALVIAAQTEPLASTRIFFEEPEAHLYPSAQILLTESIAHLTRKNLRFVLTTHSPYVVYALNNFLMAQQVIDAGGTLPKNRLLQDTALRRDQVSAYRFSDSGQVESIFDEETGLIQTDVLDDPAGELNQLFGELQTAWLEKQPQ